MFGGLVFADLDLVHSLRWEERQRIANGLNVVIATSAGSIDTALCEGLVAQTGFRQAGSLREGGLKVLASDRSTLIPTGAASVGLFQLWGFSSISTLSVPGILVGEMLGRGEALVPGGYVAFVDDDRPHLIQAALPESGRASRVAGWVVSAEPPAGSADQCWAETEPELRDHGEVLMRTLFGGDQPVEITTLIDLDDRSRDLEADFDSRVAKSLQLPLVLVLLLTAALSTYARRSEYGLYRALNMRPVHVLFTTQIEWLIYIIFAVVIGLSSAVTATYFRWTQRSDMPLLRKLDVALLDITPVVATAILAAPGIAALTRSDLTVSLKDR